MILGTISDQTKFTWDLWFVGYIYVCTPPYHYNRWKEIWDLLDIFQIFNDIITGYHTLSLGSITGHSGLHSEWTTYIAGYIHDIEY